MVEQGRLDEAEPLLLEAMPVLMDLVGLEHRHTILTLELLETIYLTRGDTVSAARCASRASVLESGAIRRFRASSARCAEGYPTRLTTRPPHQLDGLQ